MAAGGNNKGPIQASALHGAPKEIIPAVILAHTESPKIISMVTPKPDAAPALGGQQPAAKGLTAKTPGFAGMIPSIDTTVRNGPKGPPQSMMTETE